MTQPLNCSRSSGRRGRKPGPKATVAFIGYVCGTDLDPQDRAKSVAGLKAAGVLVASSNAEAAVWSATLIAERQGSQRMKKLFAEDLKVVNIGLQGFANNITAAGGQVTNITWAPPAAPTRPGLDAGHPRRRSADRGGQPRRLRPVSGRTASAGRPGAGGRGDRRARSGERRILHSGPPIAWPDMCGPQRGAIAGTILYEGWADDLEAAEKLAESGAVALEPCHEHSAVGPMAGIISPSMPVWVVENTAAGNRAYCNLNEGLGKVLRFGANSPEVLDRLRWLGGEFFETMQVAVRGLADPDLKPLMAQALHMGDELHNRNAAASALLFKRLTLALLDSGSSPRRCANPGLRRRQRPLLLEHLDGGVQVDDRRRRRCARQQHGHRDGAQRRELRHQAQRHRRPVVPGARQSR